MSTPSLQIKKRLIVLLVMFSLLVTALLVRLVWLQFVQGEKLQKLAFEQLNRGRFISPKRGIIFDRNGKELAISASVETISVSPQDLKSSKKDLGEIARQLAGILDMDEGIILQKMSKASYYETIKAKVDKEVGDKVRKWRQENNIIGVNIDEDTKRFYPYRNLAAHVIGFTGSDNQGLGGIEYMMEQYLKGVPGKILSEIDARGRELPFNEEKHIDPQDGLNIVLTLDETIQYLAEKALEKAVIDYKLKEGAMAIVMDPRNGEVLALASKPDFDLNSPNAAPPGVDPATWNGHTDKDIDILQRTVWRNKAVQDTYEPGSTFKAITSSAGLEENVITPESRVNDYTVTVGGWKMDCWQPNAHGEESFREGVYNSCNPVFVRLAQSLGIDRFYKYARAFGFYDRTKIDLPGEAMSNFHKKPTEVDMAAASFGQRFQIAPIQLICAYAAIANGGSLLKPQIIKEITDSQGNIIKKIEPEVVRNVISKKTSDTMKDILEGVVSKGTGLNAYVKGYRVAGKTGTSETTQSKTTNRYIASFAAFAPADNPVICVLIALDHPDVYPYTGGMVAAPVAGKLVEDILSYLEVERRYTELDKELMSIPVNVPELRNKTIAEATKTLDELKLKYRIEGDSKNANAVILEQTPKPDASIFQNSIVILYTYKPEKGEKVTVPDVLNKTVDEATETFNKVGLNIRVNGLGTAVKQYKAPGTEVPRGEVIDVDFRYIDLESQQSRQ